MPEYEREAEHGRVRLPGGAMLPTAKAVCPECETLDTETSFDDLGGGRWRLTCPRKHTWEVFV